MNSNRYRLPFFRALPVLLLTAFLSTQIGLIGHLHADDSHVADCLQCQFDNGQAAITSSKIQTVQVPADVSYLRPVLAAPTAAIFSLKARGPPTLS